MSWKKSTGAWSNPTHDPGARAAVPTPEMHFRSNDSTLPQRSPVPSMMMSFGGAGAGMPPTPPSREASPQRSARLGPQPDPLEGSSRFANLSHRSFHNATHGPADHHSAEQGAYGAATGRGFLPPSMRGQSMMMNQSAQHGDGLVDTPRQSYAGTHYQQSHLSGAPVHPSALNSPASLRDFRGQMPPSASAQHQHQQPAMPNDYEANNNNTNTFHHHGGVMPGLSRDAVGSIAVPLPPVNTPARHWVTITDVSLLDVMTVVHFVSFEFGPVERHVVPTRTGTLPTWFYIQFSEALHAAQAVSRRRLVIRGLRSPLGVAWCQDTEMCMIPSAGPQSREAVLFARGCVSSSRTRDVRHIGEINVAVEKWYHVLWQMLHHPTNLAMFVLLLGYLLGRFFGLI